MLREAAATAYMDLHADELWASAGSAWCGALLAEGGLFEDQRDKSVVLSLGFHSWMALCLPMQLDVHDGQDFCFL